MEYKRGFSLQVAFALTAAAALAATHSQAVTVALVDASSLLTSANNCSGEEASHTVDLDALSPSIIGGSDTQTDGGSSRTTNYDLDEISFFFWVSHNRTRTGGQSGPNYGFHAPALTSENVRFTVDETVNYTLSSDYSVSGENIFYN